MTGDDLRDRIGRLYMERRDRSSPYGAVAWFGEQIGKSHSTVHRWLTGETPVPDYVDKMLELMEWQSRVLNTTTAQVEN